MVNSDMEILIYVYLDFQSIFDASLTWKENNDRILCAEIRFFYVVFSEFSEEIPFHHRPGQIERINW